jgi:hypothetical protein
MIFPSVTAIAGKGLEDRSAAKPKKLPIASTVKNWGTDPFAISAKVRKRAEVATKSDAFFAP